MSEAISSITGLPILGNPTSTPKKEEAPKISSITGLEILPAQRSTRGFTATDLESRSIDLTNAYPDPIEDYAKYNVPLSPFVDWNETRAQNQGTFEKWVNGLTKATITAGGAVLENTAGLIAGLGSVLTGGSFYDNAVGRGVDSVNEWAQRELPNYYTKEEQYSSTLGGMLYANFWADKVANGVGYTLGSIATMLIGTGEASLAAKLGTLGKTGKAFQVLGKVDDAAPLLSIYRTAKGINQGENIAALTSSLARTANRARIASAAERTVLGVQMSLAESSVEARETKNRYIEEKTAEWEAANPGMEMPLDVADKITAEAYAAGNIAFAINLPVLATSNLIMFGKTLRGIQGKTSKAIYDLERKGTGEAMKWVETIPDAATAKAFAKSYKYAAPIVKNAVTEGVQEGAQFFGSEFGRNYVNSGYDDMIESASKALSTTLGTKEGLENILIGAIVGGGQSSISVIAGAEKKARDLKSETTQKAIELLDSGGITNAIENMEATKANLTYMAALTAANEAGDTVTADIMRNRIIMNMVDRYNKVGAMDYLYEQLDDMYSMDEAEFKKSFGYIESKTLEEQTGMSQQEIISEMKQRAESSVKRIEQVRDILASYTPSKNLVNSLLGISQSEEAKTNKAMVKAIRNTAANMMVQLMVDTDVLDQSIDSVAENLRDKAKGLPGLERAVNLLTEDILYKVRFGQLAINDEGKLTYSGEGVLEELDPKDKKEIDAFNRAIDALHVQDKATIKKEFNIFKSLLKSREMLIGNYALMTSSPIELENYIKNVEAAKKEQDQKNANSLAQNVIDTAESASELNEEFPANASDELKELARKKREELIEQEDILTDKFYKMSDNELGNVIEEDLSPIQQSAYRRALVKKAEDAADAANSKTITLTEKPEVAFTEGLTDLEKSAFETIQSSESQNTFYIQGREYINDFEDPIDAIVTDAEGNPIGVTLLDAATGKRKAFKKTSPEDLLYGVSAERENATVDVVVNAILMADNSIRADRTTDAEEALEELTTLAEGSLEDAVQIEEFEKEVKDKLSNLPNQELDKELNDPSKTAGLTDEQLRAQIEVLKNEIDYNEGLLSEYNKIANELKISHRQRKKDPTISSLHKKNSIFKKALTARINELKTRTATAKSKEADLSQGQIAEEVNQGLTESEASSITNAAEAKIQKLTEELEKLQKEKKFYEDYANDTSEEISEDDRELARAEVKKLNRKIGAKKGQITKQTNLVNKANEKLTEEQPAEDSTADGTVQQTEGQNSPGTEFTPTTGIEGEEKSGISEEEAERRKKLEEAKTKSVYTPAANPATTSAELSAQSPGPVTDVVTIQSEGDLDIQLAPIEYRTVETASSVKVLMAGTQPAEANDVQQTVLGEPIAVDPAYLTDPSVDMDEHIIEFEVREDTDYWAKVTGEELAEADYYKKVPIFVIAVNKETGKRTRVGILQATNDEKSTGVSRKDIYDLHKQELTPVTTATKFFSGRNIANAITIGNDEFFKPVNSLVTDNSQVVGFGIVSLSKGQVVIRDSNVSRLPNAPETQVGDIIVDNLTPGQVVAIVVNPDGNVVPIPLSTKDITPEAVQTVKELILGDEGFKVPYIVGMNRIPGTVASEDDVIVTEDDNYDQVVNSRDYMSMSLTSEDIPLFTFYSASAKGFIKVSGPELKKALMGGKPRFSFVQAETNEKGYVEFVNVAKDRAVYKAVEDNIAEEFMNVVSTKKYQVDKTRLISNEAFTSPVTGTTYNSYLDYLSSEDEITSDIEVAGSKAVLSTDIATLNNYGSPYFNLGLKFKSLGTIEKDVKSEKELADNSVAKTADSLIVTEPATTTTTPTSVSDIENQITAVKNAKTKDELIKASEQLIGINPYDDGAVSMGTRAALMTPGNFERGKELFLQEVKGSIETKKQTELADLEGKTQQQSDVVFDEGVIDLSGFTVDDAEVLSALNAEMTGQVAPELGDELTGAPQSIPTLEDLEDFSPEGIENTPSLGMMVRDYQNTGTPTNVAPSADDINLFEASQNSDIFGDDFSDLSVSSNKTVTNKPVNEPTADLNDLAQQYIQNKGKDTEEQCGG